MKFFNLILSVLTMLILSGCNNPSGESVISAAHTPFLNAPGSFFFVQAGPKTSYVNAATRKGEGYIQWSNSEGASSYQVLTGSSPTSLTTQVSSCNQSATNCTIPNLDPNTTYYFKVIATNPAGTASASTFFVINLSAPTVSFDGGNVNNAGQIGSPVSITPSSLNPNGGAISSCSVTPALPSWASINNSTCVISGTPTSTQPSTNYTLTATNSEGSTSTTFNIHISVAQPSISYSSSSGKNGNVAIPMTVTPSALNGGGETLSSCTISPALPSWATINSTTCVISGTPSATLAASTFTVTASNSSLSGSATVTLSVGASAPTISFSGATGTSGTVGIPMLIAPSSLSLNGATISNCTITPALPSWAALNTSTCTISGTPTNSLSSTTYIISATNSQGTSSGSVTLSVAASGPTISFASSTGTTGSVGNAMMISPSSLNNNGSIITSCTASPALPVWASINSSTCIISGTPTSTLASTLYTITATNSAGASSANVTLMVSASAPIISYSGSAGTNGSVGPSLMTVTPSTLDNRGAAITSCVASPALPAWATINSSTCVISGTPNAILASTVYTVTATNSSGASTANVTLVVSASAPTLSYSASTGTSGSVGNAMTIAPSSFITNGAALTSCSASPALPAWASINASTCVISGTPTATVASTAYTITATNSAGSTTASVTLSVGGSVPIISYAASTGITGSYGNAMTVTPSTLNNNGAAITSCSASPALPAWASINASTCVISGTPNSTLTSTPYTITATNSAGSTTASVTLAVSASAPTISYSASTGTNGSVSTIMTVTPSTISSNGAAISSCSASPALPAWASINASTCVISGTPTSTLASTAYTITATNSAGSTTASVTLSVGGSAPVISYAASTGTTGTYGNAMTVSPSTLNNNGAAVTSCSASPALPAWASINASTCVISGTPTATLTSTSYTITATNSAGSTTAIVTIAVSASVPTISYAASTGTTGTYGNAMTVTPSTLNNNGAAVTSCSASPALPAWASINASTCVISGTPTSTLTSTVYTITATNSAGSSTSSVTLSVGASVPTISYSASTGTSGSYGNAMTVTPSTLNNNGAAITTCSISPALPAWASINASTCVISGTSTSILTSTSYIITATNSAGSTTASVTLAVNASAPTISYSASTGTSGSYGNAMTVTPSTLNNNGAAVTSCSASPALPAWASINASTCVISGTPTTTLTSTVYTITATNSSGSSTASVSLSVGGSVPTISYSASTGTSGSYGNAMTITPSTLNNNGAAVTTCSASPALPAWASINASTCVISGTPTSTLTSTVYTITATNSAGSSTAGVSLAVNASVPTISYSASTGTNGSVGAMMTVTPSTLMTNGATVTSCSASPALPSWASINASTCVISGTPTSTLTTTSFTITGTNSAGSSTASVSLSVGGSVPTISYSASTGTSGSYGNAMTITPSTLNNNGATVTSCSASPALPAWASINASTCVISGTPTSILGSTSYSITATNSAGSSSANVTLSVVASVPTISYSTSTGTSGSYGNAMTVTPSTLNNNGAAVTSCSASPALPAWASINASTCVISGTPTSTLASTSYTITATNSAGSNTASVTLAVTASIPTISYSGSTGNSGTYGNAMTVTPSTLNNNGGPVTSCSASPALPTWATINASTCVISGTPNSTLASTTYTITATNSAGSSTASVTLAVNASAPTISFVGALGTSSFVGVPMTVSPTALNINGSPVTSCAISPALPAGLSINNSTCVITGSPTVVIMATIFTVTATNSAGANTAQVTLTIGASAPTLSYSGSTGTSGQVGVAMSVTPSQLVENGAAVTSCSSSPALPAGLSINSITCVISGTPTGLVSATSFSISATNSAGTTSNTLTLTVNPGAPSLAYDSIQNSGDVNSPMSVLPLTLSNNGATITGCSSSPTLPTGLSLNATTCEISGTPTAQLATTTYSITATNSAGSSPAAPVILYVAPLTPPAFISFADGSSFDFQNVSDGGNSEHTFTITNDGSQNATGLSGLGLGNPFDFFGGSFPGTGGTCTSTLAIGASCDVVITFAPTAAGSYSDSLSLSYHNGVQTVTSSIGLTGTGIDVTFIPTPPTLASQTTNGTTGTTASSNMSVTKPTGTTSGDLIVLILNLTTGTRTITTPPSGFTLLRDEGTQGAKIAIYYRIAGASEPATYTATLNNTSLWKMNALRFTDVETSNPITTVAGANTGALNSTTLTVPSISTSVSNQHIIAAWTISSITTAITGDSSLTQQWSATTAAPSFYGASQTQLSIGSSGSKTISWTGTSTTKYASGVIFAVRPKMLIKPDAPINFALNVATNTSVHLEWTIATTGGIPNLYYVERAQDIGGSPGPYSVIGSTSNLYFRDTGLTNSATYWYRIYAENSYGAGLSTTAISIRLAPSFPKWHRPSQNIASGATASGTILKPNGLYTGDLILLTYHLRSNSTVITPPSGFTLIRSEKFATTTSAAQIATYYKIATAAEPATYAITLNGATNWKAFVAQVTGFNASSPIGTQTGANSGSTTVNLLQIPAMTTTTNNSLVIANWTNRGVTTLVTPPSSMTQFSTDLTTSPSSFFYYEQKALAGSTTTKTLTWTGSANQRAAGIMFEIKPLP